MGWHGAALRDRVQGRPSGGCKAELMPPPCWGRNAAGKDSRERRAGSVLEQVPFLQSCEDEDSDEDDELDSGQHKKQRVKVRRTLRGRQAPGLPRPSCSNFLSRLAPGTP